MTTMTRPVAARSATQSELRPAARRPPDRDRFGRSSKVPLAGAELFALASFLVAVAASPELALWLLLPVAPAVLLRWAGSEARASCAKRVMRVFSLATLAAVAVQVATTELSIGITATSVVATLVFLGSVERVGAGDADSPRHSDTLGPGSSRR